MYPRSVNCAAPAIRKLSNGHSNRVGPKASPPQLQMRDDPIEGMAPPSCKEPMNRPLRDGFAPPEEETPGPPETLSTPLFVTIGCVAVPVTLMPVPAVMERTPVFVTIGFPVVPVMLMPVPAEITRVPVLFTIGLVPV